MSTEIRWTVADLDIFPEPLDDTRYEVIDGELFVSTQPHANHQLTAFLFLMALGTWNRSIGRGTVVPAPGVILGPDLAVAPDVVWYAPGWFVIEEDGTSHRAPDAVLEVLSPGARNEQRDREKKLDLYSRHGVQEYWIADWRDRTVEVYRRRDAQLHRVATLRGDDTLTSPLLPGFSARLAELFPGPT